jgi:predicted AAA+ superfamily ATPase
MIRRRVTAVLRQRLRAFPVVALVGARQCGKTTLARSLRGRYFDLEQPEERLRLDVEWDGVVRSRGLTILDEAQTWPAVFPRLRGAIDADRKRNGRFLLLGSVSPGLMREVSESLAGRLALCELTPFLVTELPRQKADRLWLQGGYPDGGVLGSRTFPEWQRSYLALLAQRDLPSWGLPARPPLTERLFKMLAVSHGSVWHAAPTGASLGLSYHTVSSYLEYVQGAYLVRLLPPLLPNLRKRLIRSPKLYWRDSGLLHALLGVTSREHLLAQPWLGASWEGWVIEQVLAHLSSRGRGHEAYFLRTSDGLEIDLVLELGRTRWAIEIKLTTSPSPADMERLVRAADLIGADRRCLVSRTSRPAESATVLSCGVVHLLEALDEGS